MRGRIFWSAAVGGGMVFVLAGCPQKPTHDSVPTPVPDLATPTPTPTATPEAVATPVPPPPTPTPVPRFPNVPLDARQLFSEVTYSGQFTAKRGERTASASRIDPMSYTVEVRFAVERPQPAISLKNFAIPDASLAKVLAKIPGFIEQAKVASAFDKIYDLKEEAARKRIARLDLVVSRHNYYDCDTILEWTAGSGGRKVLFLKGDMDVNVDGADSDRNCDVDISGIYFQPQTSWKWKRRSEREGLVIPKIQKLLDAVKTEQNQSNLLPARSAELKELVTKYTGQIRDLKAWSFLISEADPSIVMPSFMLQSQDGKPASCSVGDYAVVIHKGKLYPMIVGDAGPSYKFGEASLRLCKILNPRAGASRRPVSDLSVGYIVFPQSADAPGPPDYERWRVRCQELLAEIGYPDALLESWEDILLPWSE